MVNHFYFYGVDRDFGPFFIKFCTYFPYNARVCLNGHEYLKRQLERRGIPYEPLDNGILSCEDPARLQRLSSGPSPYQIDSFFRKWLARLPHPFTGADRRAGYRYQLAVLQAEFALTQVLDRPLAGCLFFEQAIREHLDLGRPDRVQLVFDRRITRRTPGRFRTRVITAGVYPSLYIDYKHSRIRQYYKEGRALRTETTINDPYDFAVGKRLPNLPTLRQVAVEANRRLLRVLTTSHDCALGEDTLQALESPTPIDGQRVSALRFAQPRVQALLQGLVMMAIHVGEFSNRDLRERVAPLLGLQAQAMTAGRMTYDLRRLRLHGLIERIPGHHRYRLTDFGLRLALFYTRTYARLLRPCAATASSKRLPGDRELRAAFDQVDRVISTRCQELKLAA